jgi:hypothetical protein
VLALAIVPACTRERDCAKLQELVEQIGRMEYANVAAAVPPETSADDEVMAATRRSIDRAVARSRARCTALEPEAFACVDDLQLEVQRFLTAVAACPDGDRSCHARTADQIAAALTPECTAVFARIYCRGTDEECG